MLWRVIEAEVVPTCEELGIGQIVWSPIAQGVLTGKYKPGQQPPDGLARHRREGRREHDQRLLDDDVLDAGAAAEAARRGGWACRMAQLAVAWVLQNHNVAARDHRRLPAGAGPRQRQGGGVKLDAELLKRIDEVLGRVVERDPAKIEAPTPRSRPT